MQNDISGLLGSWPYDPGADIVARIIPGADGRSKLQMRVDLGIMQMELDGNPSGETHDGCETWFSWYEARRREAESAAVDDYFVLTEQDCEKLRAESVHYYYRYLCLMKLEDYRRVIRDTDRNLGLFSFVKKYAAREIDRCSLEQDRPYVIMMHTRARETLAICDHPGQGIEMALEMVNRSIERIQGFYQEYDIESEREGSVELSVLEALKQEFEKNTPLSLEEKLRKAVDEERYEDAAHLRDLIARDLHQNRDSHQKTRRQ